MHLKEQLKIKALSDISISAYNCDVNVFSLSTLSSVIMDSTTGHGEVINITQTNENNQGSWSNLNVGTNKSVSRKFNHYNEVLSLLARTDQYDRLGKQHLFKDLIKQLDYQNTTS